MTKEELRDQYYGKALDEIMNESMPGESNLVALLAINLRLLVEKIYKQGWDDGCEARELYPRPFEEAQDDGRS